MTKTYTSDFQYEKDRKAMERLGYCVKGVARYDSMHIEVTYILRRT